MLKFRRAATLGLTGTLLLCGSLTSITPVAAQVPPATAAATGRTAKEVLTALGTAAGVTVVADSTVTEAVAMPTNPTTMDNLETQIAAVVSALPAGTVWAKIYLPAPKDAKIWTGDALVGYARAQASLFGSVGGKVPEGMVEVMGQRLPAEKAQAVITALNLKPVYLVTNPSKGLAITSGSVSPGQWTTMTPEQRQEYARAQAAQLVNTDPEVRKEMLQQQITVFGEFMRQLPPEQRRDLIQGVGAMFGGAMVPGTPAGQGGPNGPGGRGQRGNNRGGQ